MLKRGAAILIAAIVVGITLIVTLDEFANEYKVGTIVGDIDLSGKTKSEVNYDILLGVNDYITDYYIVVEFNNEAFTLSSDIVVPNIASTVSNVTNGKRTSVEYDISTTLLKSELETVINPMFIELINLDEVEAVIARSLLDNEPFSTINIHDLILDYTSLWEPINSYEYIDLNNTGILDNLDDVSFIVAPNSRFSLLNNSHELFLTNDELSILATGIQVITIETDFVSFIKTNHKNPSYDLENERDIYDTYINIAQGKDFSFYNPNNFEYVIEITKSQNKLVFNITGIPFENEYTHKVVELLIPYQVLTGSIPTQGRDGMSYEVIRYIKRDEISLLDQSLYTNFYAPINEIN